MHYNKYVESNRSKPRSKRAQLCGKPAPRREPAFRIDHQSHRKCLRPPSLGLTPKPRGLIERPGKRSASRPPFSQISLNRTSRNRDDNAPRQRKRSRTTHTPPPLTETTRTGAKEIPLRTGRKGGNRGRITTSSTRQPTQSIPTTLHQSVL